MRTMNLLLSQVAAADRDEVADARLGMRSARQLQTSVGRANQTARHRDRQMNTTLDTVKSAHAIASQVASLLATAGSNGSAALDDIASGEFVRTIQGMAKVLGLEGLTKSIIDLFDGDFWAAVGEFANSGDESKQLQAVEAVLGAVVEVGLQATGLGGLSGIAEMRWKGLRSQWNPSMLEATSRLVSGSGRFLEVVGKTSNEDEESARREAEALVDELVSSARQRLQDSLREREQLLRMSMA